MLLQLLGATALAKDWIGLLPEPGPTIYYGCEDSTDELHRRLACIADHYHASFAALIAAGFRTLSYAGVMGASLCSMGKLGRMEPTGQFHKLYDEACAIRPRIIVLDTVSDVFEGSEIDRLQVRQFMGLLRKLAIDANCTVIVAAHPSVAGIASGSGISGSTAWHNSVRSRMYLMSAAGEQGDKSDDGLRELQFLKNQYGAISKSILLRWRNGLFLSEPTGSTLDKITADLRV